ncbi:Gp37 family protein [Psychrobacter aquaticus]|uniref:Phage protein n=1 Tax=Psychrobacter aquaticus CMS 56 TaxID=1354303 RepID=U4T5G7_9GAMM|nr:Gp37 family protein [Psychrobacter aquaticus]ERL56140.1 hypothetical protein M917_0818 [Psychrobacter aquaticus CMS 56]
MGLPEHSLTTTLSQSIVDQLSDTVGNELAVEFYPEKPANYRLNHANGALLVNYGKSNYPKHNDTYAVVRPRTMMLTITIVSRGLYDRYGAVPLVDWVLAMLSGFTPTHCDQPLSPVRDYFIQHQSGLWYYGVDFETEAVLVQTLPINEF